MVWSKGVSYIGRFKVVLHMLSLSSYPKKLKKVKMKRKDKRNSEHIVSSST